MSFLIQRAQESASAGQPLPVDRFLVGTPFHWENRPFSPLSQSLRETSSLAHRVGVESAVPSTEARIALQLWATKNPNRRVAANRILVCFHEKRTALDLSLLELDSLPDLLFCCTHLKILLLGRNKLTSISPKIGQLIHLKTCALWENSISTLPEEMGDLPLQRLSLEANKIRSLPSSFVHLPSSCTIALERNPIKQEDLFPFTTRCYAQRLQNLAQGPEITHLYNDPFTADLERWLLRYREGLEKSEPYLAEEIGFPLAIHENPFYQPLYDLGERKKGVLLDFLSKIEKTADYKARPKETGERVLSFLTGICQNPHFAEEALSAAEEALRNCTDRCSFYLGNIDLLWFLHIGSESQDLSTLGRLLIGSHRLNLLDEIVRRKIHKEEIYDGIQVNLYVRISLKQSLQLPLRSRSMEFNRPNLIKTTKEELQQIQKEIEARSTKSEDLLPLLKESPLWQEKLKKEFQEEFTKILEESSEQLSAFEEEPDMSSGAYEILCKGIKEQYNVQVKELVLEKTREWILQNSDLSQKEPDPKRRKT